MVNRKHTVHTEVDYYCCGKCERTLEDEWEYCPFCGETVEEEGEEVENSKPTIKDEMKAELDKGYAKSKKKVTK